MSKEKTEIERSRIQKSIEKIEKEILTDSIKQNHILKMDLFQKKYHYEQQLRKLNKKK